MATNRPFEDARMAMLDAARTTGEEGEFDAYHEGNATIRGLAVLFTLAGGSTGHTPPRLSARDVASYINNAISEYCDLILPDDVDERLVVSREIWQALTDRATEVLPGLNRATRQTETVVWSVVRGESPDSRAVEPGPYDITVPDEVLAWAEGYGVGTDTDVYVLVTPADEAGEVLGEIASMTAQATAENVAAIRAALAERAAER